MECLPDAVYLRISIISRPFNLQSFRSIRGLKRVNSNPGLDSGTGYTLGSTENFFLVTLSRSYPKYEIPTNTKKGPFTDVELSQNKVKTADDNYGG